jgi:hypothetical protein
MFVQLSVVHLYQAVTAHGKTAIMRGHQERYTLRGHEVEQQIEDHLAGLLIEGTCRLIGEQYLRRVHQCAAERCALALSTGEFLDGLIEPMTESGALRKPSKARHYERRSKNRPQSAA